MEPFWICFCLGLLCAYVIFVAAPAVTVFYCVFLQKYRDDAFRLNKENGYFSMFSARLSAEEAFLQSRPNRLVTVTTGDGTALRARILANDSEKTVVFLHGYRALPLDNFAAQAACLYREGFNVVFLHQRAHGGSGGFTTMGCKEQQDLLDVLPALAEETGAKGVLVYGTSMGCATVAYASDRLDPALVKAMVLDCGYTSPYQAMVNEMHRHHVPLWVMKRWILFLTRVFLGVDVRSRVAESLARTRIPALFLHGGADKTVSEAEGRASFDACASPKEWYCVPEAVHTTCFLSGGEEARERLLHFVRTYFS